MRVGSLDKVTRRFVEMNVRDVILVSSEQIVEIHLKVVARHVRDLEKTCTGHLTEAVVKEVAYLQLVSRVLPDINVKVARVVVLGHVNLSRVRLNLSFLVVSSRQCLVTRLRFPRLTARSVYFPVMKAVRHLQLLLLANSDHGVRQAVRHWNV